MESTSHSAALSSPLLEGAPEVDSRALGPPVTSSQVLPPRRDPPSVPPSNIAEKRQPQTFLTHVYGGISSRPDDSETSFSAHVDHWDGDDPPPSVASWAERLSPGVTTRICVKDFNAIVSAVFHVTERRYPHWPIKTSAEIPASTVAASSSPSPLVTIVNQAAARGERQGNTPRSQPSPKPESKKQSGKGNRAKVPVATAAARKAPSSTTPQMGGSIDAGPLAQTAAKAEASKPRPSKAQGQTTSSKSASVKQLRSRVRRKIVRSLQTKVDDGGTLWNYLEVTDELLDKFLNNKGLAEMEAWGKPDGLGQKACYLEASGFLEQSIFTENWGNMAALEEWHEGYLRRREIARRRSEARPHALHREYVSPLDGTPSNVRDLVSTIAGASPQVVQSILGLPGLRKEACINPLTVRIMPGPKGGGGHWVKVRVVFSSESLPYLTIPAAHPSYSGDGRFMIYLTSVEDVKSGRRFLAFRQTMNPPFRLQRTANPVSSFRSEETVAVRKAPGTDDVGVTKDNIVAKGVPHRPLSGAVASSDTWDLTDESGSSQEDHG